MLEYGLVTPDEEKHRQGCNSHKKDFITEWTKNTSLLIHLNPYIINYKSNIQSYTDIKTKINRWQNLFLNFGQQQQWEAVPSYQLLESAQTVTPQDPRACSGLPG